MIELFNILGVIHWNIDPSIFSIGALEPRWYGVLFATSFIVGYVIIEQMFKWENRDLKDLDKLMIYMVVATVVGARLGHCIFYDPVYYFSNPVRILMIWKGGLASHGAAIAILLALAIFVKKYKSYSYLWVVDRVVPVVAISGVFIRTGNFFNSEIVGIPSTQPWAVLFERIDPRIMELVPRHPVQLYEALAYACIFLLLFFLYKKWKENTPRGLLTGLFMVLIFSARFFIEIWKIPQVGFEMSIPIKMGQLLSIPFIITGIVLIIYSMKNRTKNISSSLSQKHDKETI